MSIRDQPGHRKFTQICHNKNLDAYICCRPQPTPPDESLFDYRHAEEDLKVAWDDYNSEYQKWKDRIALGETPTGANN